MVLVAQALFDSFLLHFRSVHIPCEAVDCLAARLLASTEILLIHEDMFQLRL